MECEVLLQAVDGSPGLLGACLFQLLQGVVGALDVGGVVLVVVELDDLRVDDRFERRVVVREFRERVRGHGANPPAAVLLLLQPICKSRLTAVRGECDRPFGSGPQAHGGGRAHRGRTPDACAAWFAPGAQPVGSWNSALGATPVLEGVTASPLGYRTGVVFNYRFLEGGWLPGGTSGGGGGALTAAFPDGSRRDRTPRPVTMRQPAAGHMVRIRLVLRPDPARTARHTAPYPKLVDELERRGRWPGALAAHARARTESR